MRPNTLNYQLDKPLPIRKNQKIMKLMNDKLGVKIMTEFPVLRPKTYSYLTDDSDKNKKAKGTKKSHKTKT